MSTLREQLQKIHEERGSLTPSLVVDEARDPAHPLHARFEWDDSIAGEKYRQQQASELIRSVKVTSVTGEELTRVRAYHSVPTADGATYVPIEDVQADPFTRRLVLQQAEREYTQLLKRYQHLKEFLEFAERELRKAASQ